MCCCSDLVLGRKRDFLKYAFFCSRVEAASQCIEVSFSFFSSFICRIISIVRSHKHRLSNNYPLYFHARHSTLQRTQHTSMHTVRTNANAQNIHQYTQHISICTQLYAHFLTACRVTNTYSLFLLHSVFAYTVCLHCLPTLFAYLTIFRRCHTKRTLRRICGHSTQRVDRSLNSKTC